MSFPRYPKYKPSGVEWLGEVPEHWEVRRLKQACSVFPSNVDKKSYEGESAVLLCNYTDVYYNDAITSELDFMAATATEDQIAKFTLRAGDTIITKDSETADDIAIAAYVPNDLPGVICGYHLSMVRPRDSVHGPFVKRLFDSSYAKSCFAVRANGLTRVGLGQYALDNVELPFPPLPEQRAIAAFLDRETGKIDALVEEQRGLIGLLKEKRQAVISHAVTKGLNPKAKLKDSGIEWLGMVPEHWEVGRLSTTSEILAGYSFDAATFGFDGTPVIRMSDFGAGLVRLDDAKRVDPDIVPETAKALAGDILVGLSGSISNYALVRRSDLPIAINQRIAIIRPKKSLHDLVKWFIQSSLFTDQIIADLPATTIQNVSMGQIRSCRLPVPPEHEQNAITTFLDAETAKLDALVAEAEGVVALLQERRSALISAAVTGGIDVR